MTTETETLITGTDTTQAGEETTAEVKTEGEGAVAPEAQADATKTEDTTKAAEADPVYEFKLPEGVQGFDQPVLDKFTTIAKETKVSPEVAQKFLDLAAEQRLALDNNRVEMVKGWAESVKTDKEIGGDKLTENLATAKKAIDLGPPELKDLLNVSGLGNHPAVVKWAIAVGKALSEDRFVPGSKAPAGADKTAAQRLYDKTT